MAKVIILLEIQGAKILLWVNCECIKTWRRGHTNLAGAPLELARHIEASFAVAHVPALIQYGDGFEEIAEYDL